LNDRREPLINPYLAVLLALLALSVAAIFTRLATAPPLAIAFYRLFFTVLLILPFSLTRGSRSELMSISRQDLILAMTAGISLGLHFTVWITSLHYTSIASSTVLVTMQPLFVFTFGYFFLHEKLSRPGAIGATLALAGSLIIGAADFHIGGQSLYGDLLAFSGAFFVAVYYLIGRRLRSRLSLFPYIFLVYSTGLVFLLAVNLSAGVPFYPYPPMDWFWFFALALVPTICGHTVFNWALRYVKTAVVSVANLGEPVGASLLALLIFKESPGSVQIGGALLIIAGIYLFISTTSASNHK
jgi:drug/metabolite transporter (DMT)-like permease